MRIDESRLIAAHARCVHAGPPLRRCRRSRAARSSMRMAPSARASTARNSCRSGCVARHRGLTVPFEEFSLTTMAARQDRMLLPDAATEGFGFTDYGYHLPAIPYGAWLRAARPASRRAQPRDAHARGPGRRAARHLPSCCSRTGAASRATSFSTSPGGEALLANALGVARESWRDAFVADRVLSGLGALLSPVPIHSEIRAQPTGWMSLAASQVCVHVQQAYLQRPRSARPGRSRPPRTCRCSP